MKRKALNVMCVFLIVATLAIIIWGVTVGGKKKAHKYSDGIEQINPDTIRLEASGVEVNFSDVILSKQKEQRKLVVSTQNAEASIEITDKIFEQLDYRIFKKSQKVNCKAQGNFVVDLDKITRASILQDNKKKIVTIKINHAYLDNVSIDPDLITVDDVKEGFFARGDVKLSVKDYPLVESLIKKQMEEKLNTAENKEAADAIALQAVKKVYEPLVKAVDGRYELVIAFI